MHERSYSLHEIAQLMRTLVCCSSATSLGIAVKGMNAPMVISLHLEAGTSADIVLLFLDSEDPNRGIARRRSCTSVSLFSIARR